MKHIRLHSFTCTWTQSVKFAVLSVILLWQWMWYHKGEGANLTATFCGQPPKNRLQHKIIITLVIIKLKLWLTVSCKAQVVAKSSCHPKCVTCTSLTTVHEFESSLTLVQSDIISILKAGWSLGWMVPVWNVISLKGKRIKLSY